MAVSSQTNSVNYAGNNSTVTAYTIPFPFLETAHLRLSTLADEAGEWVTLSPSVYTVTRLADGSGGSVKTSAAVPTLSIFKIERILPLTQPTVFPLAGPLPAPAIEMALDRVTMILQQLAAAIAALDPVEDGGGLGGGGGGGGGEVIIGPPSGDEDTISLAATTQNLDEAVNFRLTATFSAVGAFGDAFLRTHLTCDRANAVITPEQNKLAAGRASWVVYLKPATNVYGSALPCVFNASIRGQQWSAATIANVAATWVLEPLSL